MSEHPHANFRRYVALGDSITAGYADGALYREAQQYAWANLLAAQLRQTDGGEFRQALMPAGSPGIDPAGNARLVLKKDEAAPPCYRLINAAPKGDLAALTRNIFETEGPFHNLGVPGARVTMLPVPGFGNPDNGPGFYNPFFTRMASAPATTSVLSEALALRPTFFSLFIGNNDALAYALSGGTIGAVTPVEGPPGEGFEQSLRHTVATLTDSGAAGIIANLPPISTVPYFTSLPYNGLYLSAATAGALDAIYKQQGLTFRKGWNPFVLNHPEQGIRFLESGDLVLMDVVLDPLARDYLSGRTPLPKHFVLCRHEVAMVNHTIDSYNEIIRRTAIDFNLAFVDIYGLVGSAETDRIYDPKCLSFDFKSKGVFSLDGLHPNAFGQAIIANEFVKSINAHYGSGVPELAPSRFLPFAKHREQEAP